MPGTHIGIDTTTICGRGIVSNGSGKNMAGSNIEKLTHDAEDREQSQIQNDEYDNKLEIIYGDIFPSFYDSLLFALVFFDSETSVRAGFFLIFLTDEDGVVFVDDEVI